MSIAEKLQTIAENEQKVYDAGYEEGANDFGLKITTSAPILKINNIHPKLHKVKVSVSDGVSKIITCGKNLFDIDCVDSKWVDEDKIIHTTANVSNNRVDIPYPKTLVLPAGSYRLSWYAYVEKASSSGDARALGGVVFKKSGNKTAYSLYGKLGEWVRLSITISLSEADTVSAFWFQGYGATLLYKDIQLEAQYTLTAYEPFVGRDYPSDVSTVESIAPNMTILTDALDGMVTAEYFVDVNALASASVATLELNDLDYMGLDESEQ